MTNKNKTAGNNDKNSQPSHKVRLPGFIKDEEIGLGDVIKRTTSYFGIRPCESCERRASVLNRWLVFTNQKSK